MIERPFCIRARSRMRRRGAFYLPSTNDSNRGGSASDAVSGLTVTSVPAGKSTSTRDPNRIKPTSSPFSTKSPTFFQHTIRRAINAGNLRKNELYVALGHHNDVPLVFDAGRMIESRLEPSTLVIHRLDSSAASGLRLT